MKHVLVYTSPRHDFDEEHKILTMIQVDNIVSLGWNREDILLFTNFPYEYDGVKSTVVPDIYTIRKGPGDAYGRVDPTSNKIPVIIYLIEQKIFKDDELYFYHDFDHYQNEFITEEELEMKQNFALCSYGYKDQWQLGFFFFRTGALELFKILYDRMIYARYNGRIDEKNFSNLVKHNIIPEDSFKKLNVSYNLTMRFIQRTYPGAIKPIKCVHFHPWFTFANEECSCLDTFMYGKNNVGVVLMSDNLIKIFAKHNIK